MAHLMLSSTHYYQSITHDMQSVAMSEYYLLNSADFVVFWLSPRQNKESMLVKTC